PARATVGRRPGAEHDARFRRVGHRVAARQVGVLLPVEELAPELLELRAILADDLGMHDLGHLLDLHIDGSLTACSPERRTRPAGIDRVIAGTSRGRSDGDRLVYNGASRPRRPGSIIGRATSER